MTKLVYVRVCVPTDNEVQVDHVAEALELILAGQPKGEIGERGRIHWSAGSAGRSIDRTAGEPPPRRKKRNAPRIQPELPNDE